MNNLNQNIPPDLRSALDAFYTVPQPDPTFADRLEVQLHRRQIELMAADTSNALFRQKPRFLLPTNRSTSMHILRTRPILAVIAALLALFLLTGIAYAVGRLSGFVPGIGFVNNVQSILETPVVVTREMVVTPTSFVSGEGDSPQIIQTRTIEPTKTIEPFLSLTDLPVQEKKGITITIEQVVAEADRLVIAYKITGYPANFFAPERVPTLQAFVEAHPDEPMSEQVRLPDGTLLEHARGFGGNCKGGGDLANSWLSCQSIYKPLPVGVNQFTLQIHRLKNALPDELPEDWSIPINLSPISSTPITSSTQEPGLRSQPVNGIILQLLKTEQTPNQTAFQLGLEWEGQNRIVQQIAPITLHDGQGRYYALVNGSEGDQFSADNPNAITLSSLTTVPVEGKNPLTFRLDWIVMSTSSQESLHFNPGNDAKVGQEWVIDQTIQTGGFGLHFTNARLKTSFDGSPILEFDIMVPTEVIKVNLLSKEGSPQTESSYDKTHNVLVSRVTLLTLPTQPLDLFIHEIHYKITGPWVITWQPSR